MNSLKTKTKNYSLISGKAVAGVVLVPKDRHFEMYVAWEWVDQAENKFFAIIQSPHLIGNDTLSKDSINNVADFGIDVTQNKEAQRLFPHLF